VFPGFEDRQPLVNEDIPLPFGLPAVELKWEQRRCRGFRPPMTALEPWASHAGQIGN